MNVFFLVTLLISNFAWTQSGKLSETETRMVEEAETHARSPKGPQASERLRLRIQSEFGIEEEEKLNCTYELIGLNVIPESYVLPKKITQSDCEKKAMKALEAQASIYNKVLVKHGKNSKWKTLELKK